MVFGELDSSISIVMNSAGCSAEKKASKYTEQQFSCRERLHLRGTLIEHGRFNKYQRSSNKPEATINWRQLSDTVGVQ